LYETLIMSPHTDEAGYEILRTLLLDDIKAHSKDETKMRSLNHALERLDSERAKRANPTRQP